MADTAQQVAQLVAAGRRALEQSRTLPYESDQAEALRRRALHYSEAAAGLEQGGSAITQGAWFSGDDLVLLRKAVHRYILRSDDLAEDKWFTLADKIGDAFCK